MKMEELVESHSKLIYKIVSYYKNMGNIEDLYQVGVIGLIKAYRNFNEGKQVKFSTYAFDYIRGEILSYIRESNNIKASKEYYKLRRNYEKTKEYMTQKMGKEPTHSEICLYLEVDENYMNYILSLTDASLSLDYENENSDLYDFIGSNEWDSVEDKILLSDLLSRLNEEERKIIEYRYLKDYTQEKTAALMGLSQIAVCRKEKSAILRLQKEVM